MRRFDSGIGTRANRSAIGLYAGCEAEGVCSFDRKNWTSTMKKDVFIYIKALHRTGTPDGEEPMETAVPGAYYFRNGSHYLRYEERPEEGGEPIINYIKISPKTMEVRKKGQINTRMVFEPGRPSSTLYATPFGTWEMGISAAVLELQEGDGFLDLRVEYSLELNREHVADCLLEIQVREEADSI